MKASYLSIFNRKISQSVDLALTTVSFQVTVVFLVTDDFLGEILCLQKTLLERIWQRSKPRILQIWFICDYKFGVTVELKFQQFFSYNYFHNISSSSVLKNSAISSMAYLKIEFELCCFGIKGYVKTKNRFSQGGFSDTYTEENFCKLTYAMLLSYNFHELSW